MTRRITRRQMLREAGLAIAAASVSSLLPDPAEAIGDNGLARRLKVKQIKTYVLRTGHTFVEVFTEQGISGLGECSPMVHGSVFARLIEHAIAPRVVGRNPFDVERIWRSVFFGRYKLGPMGVYLEAIAGVDIALWDIMGKALGVPCYVLLGGKVRERVPLYASAMRMRRSPEQEVEFLRGWYERGFRAAKIHPYERWAFNQGNDDTLAVTRAVREALPDMALMVDVNNAYTVDQALRVGRALEELGCVMFEEPIAAYDYDGYARLCDALDLPIGAGEQEYTVWQHKDLIVRGHIDVIQPDVVKCGGLTELRKIGALAIAFNRPIRCHNTQPTVGTAAHYHFWVSSPMCLVEQEYPADFHPLRDRYPVLKEPLDIRNGHLHLPDRPGIGVDIDREVLNKLLV